MFWTTSCGRRVADGRWWTYWLTAPSAGWRLNDPKCAPCWPTATVPGCSSACERKPPTCPAVFCSSVADGNKDPEHPESHERGLRKNNRAAENSHQAVRISSSINISLTRETNRQSFLLNWG